MGVQSRISKGGGPLLLFPSNLTCYLSLPHSYRTIDYLPCALQPIDLSSFPGLFILGFILLSPVWFHSQPFHFHPKSPSPSGASDGPVIPALEHLPLQIFLPYEMKRAIAGDYTRCARLPEQLLRSSFTADSHCLESPLCNALYGPLGFSFPTLKIPDFLTLPQSLKVHLVLITSWVFTCP